MRIGALIVTTGLPRISGVAALLSEVGGITAGQRMISAFRCAGVSSIGLVVGPEEKKAERQLAQSGVVFLRCEHPETPFFQGLKQGLSFFRNKCDRVLVVPGDTPLFLPETVRALVSSGASVVIPEYGHMAGAPVCLDPHAMEAVLASGSAEEAAQHIRKLALDFSYIPVEDPGILIRGADMTHRQQILHNHNRQLVHPCAEVVLCSGNPLYDARLSTLLHLVEDTRSVLDACSLMQMSYSTAWNMLNYVEDELGFPLVTRIRGGAAGSGSVLTEKGKKLMDSYDRFSARISQEALRLYSEIFDPTDWN